jgi:hypothetical protein
MAGYRVVPLVDSSGYEYTACLFDFCGYDVEDYHGITSDCYECSLDNCMACKVIMGLTDTSSSDESCLKCEPGYYISETDTSDIYECIIKEDAQIGIDLFVFS